MILRPWRQCLLVVLKSSCPATHGRGGAFICPIQNEMQDIIRQMLGYASLHPVSPDGAKESFGPSGNLECV